MLSMFFCVYNSLVSPTEKKLQISNNFRCIILHFVYPLSHALFIMCHCRTVTNLQNSFTDRVTDSEENVSQNYR